MARRKMTDEEKALALISSRTARLEKALDSFAKAEHDAEAVFKAKRAVEAAELKAWRECADAGEIAKLMARFQEVWARFGEAETSYYSVRRSAREETIRELRAEVREANKPYAWIHKRY